MSPLSLAELREVTNRSVNVHLASAWSLRWHDPFWLAAWERWEKARAAWHSKWWFVQVGEITDLYDPDPTRISTPTLATVALEFIEARQAFHAACACYPGDDP